MTEQVIDIRDRIEKMRTQMTGSPNVAHDRNRQQLDNKNNLKNIKRRHLSFEKNKDVLAEWYV